MSIENAAHRNVGVRQSCQLPQFCLMNNSTSNTNYLAAGAGARARAYVAMLNMVQC